MDNLDIIIHQIDIEIKRLGWTNERGKEHLLKVYGKRSRYLLNDEELLDFLFYLKSLPQSLTSEHSSIESQLNVPQEINDSYAIDPSDIIDRTSTEIKRLGWTQERSRSYLINTYGKRSRYLLSDKELVDFLNYLQSLPSSTSDNSISANSQQDNFLAIAAQIDMELKRIGWTVEQEEKYLLKTYQKSSHFMLKDEEAMEFLNHLKNSSVSTYYDMDDIPL